MLPPPLMLLAAIALSLAFGGRQATPIARAPDLRFEAQMIDPGASETAAVTDINRDGRLDIVSGEFWYEAPSWTPHRFREIGFRSQYLDVFSDLAIDADGDGSPDIVSVSWFAKKVAWWKNPGRGSGLWKESAIHEGFNVEFAVLADVDNDGRSTEIVAQENGTGQAWYEVKEGRWLAHVVSDRTYGHGIGVGDVNKDGRNDILTPRGWLEAPVDPRAANWTFHPDWEATNPGQTGVRPGSDPGLTPEPARPLELGFMHVADVNGDGRNDVIAAAGHDFGVYWFEQPAAAGAWRRRSIDSAWSQGHASTLADLNGDGRLDFITGKRFMAHNGSDPGERDPLGVYWYEFAAVPGGGVEWIRHVIEYGGRVGAGMQLPVVDIDGDGDRDLVCPGKSGLFLLRNTRRR